MERCLSHQTCVVDGLLVYVSFFRGIIAVACGCVNLCVNVPLSPRSSSIKLAMTWNDLFLVEAET